MLSIKLLDDYLIKSGDKKIFKIQLLRDNLPQIIPEGSIVTIRISDGNKIVHEEQMDIIDAELGIVHLNFTANIGFGSFMCEYVMTKGEEIHLTFPDNGYITLNISQSLSLKFKR